MHISSGTPPHIYLRCTRSHSADGCTAPPAPYVAVEEAILNRLLNVQMKNFLQAETVARIDPTVLLKGQIQSKAETLSRLVESIATGETGAPKAIVERIARLESEIEELQKQVRNVTPAVSSENAWFEAIALRTEHARLQGDPTKLKELTELRTRMKHAISDIIDGVVFAPADKLVHVVFRDVGVRQLRYSEFMQKVGFQKGNRNGVQIA